MMWAKRLVVLGAALLLTGCLWGPGKFNSDLTLKRDGSFVLNYRGEIILQLPSGDAKTAPWKDSMARCRKSGATEIPPESESNVTDGDDDPVRPCTAAEIATLKARYQDEAARKAVEDRKQNEEMAKAFGLPGLDDASNRAFAARLMKYEGWRSVTYRGNGIYDVDYHFEGRATQDFIFPAIPDDNLIIPFIAMRRRADGSVLVTAPALTGGSGPFDAASGGASPALASGGPPPSRAEGTFMILTDGEILTNNSEDGPTANPAGRQLRWDINQSSKKVPEALIRLR
jgi:hypothetical protein